MKRDIELTGGVLASVPEDLPEFLGAIAWMKPDTLFLARAWMVRALIGEWRPYALRDEHEPEPPPWVPLLVSARLSEGEHEWRATVMARWAPPLTVPSIPSDPIRTRVGDRAYLPGGWYYATISADEPRMQLKGSVLHWRHPPEVPL